jgi:hypothetical protein
MSVTSEQSLELSETLRPVHKKNTRKYLCRTVGIKTHRSIERSEFDDTETMDLFSIYADPGPRPM